VATKPNDAVGVDLNLIWFWLALKKAASVGRSEWKQDKPMWLVMTFEPATIQ
jgi:hypothetical protein